jgi:hypothetical protein
MTRSLSERMAEALRDKPGIEDFCRRIDLYEEAQIFFDGLPLSECEAADRAAYSEELSRRITQ